MIGERSVYSFNSFVNFRVSNLRTGESPCPAALTQMPPAEIGDATVLWKKAQPNWDLLRKLLAQ